MKTLPLTVCVILGSVWLTGCSKQSESKPAADQGQPSAESTAAGVQKSVTTAAEQAKDAAKQTIADAQKQATDAGAAAQAKAQGIIDQAKTLVGQAKYPEAMSLLQQKLAGLQLTAEQQKLVDGLKEQIQKALASAPAPDVKKLLGK